MKALIKGMGITAAITISIMFIAEAVTSIPRAKLRVYGMGNRWFAEIKSVKSQDLKHIAKTAASIAALAFPLRGEGTEADGGED